MAIFRHMKSLYYKGCIGEKNLEEDETLLLLMDILEEVEEFFLKDFLADIL